MPSPGTSSSVASSQDIAGIWQGTLYEPRLKQNLRAEVKISKPAAGGYATVAYSIDQGARPMAANTTSFADGAVKFSINSIQVTYEGKISSDGKTIAGFWTQTGSDPLALNLTRTNPEDAWPLPEPPKPMAANADPSFEVATIKPSDPNRPGQAFLWRGDRFVTFNTTLMAIIGFAYDVQDKQVVGGPDWMNSEKFDIEGKPDTPGTPSMEQSRDLVRKLLEDRFQLKFHEEKKELPAYTLRVSEAGPKMAKDDTSPNGLPGLFFRGLGDLNVHNATMGDFAHLMQSAVLDRPVVDQTGLTEKWDFELKWTPDESQFGGMGMQPPPPSDAADAPPPLFTAIQEQLGLKLDSEKAKVDVMVIDHVDHPSPN